MKAPYKTVLPNLHTLQLRQSSEPQFSHFSEAPITHSEVLHAFQFTYVQYDTGSAVHPIIDYDIRDSRSERE